jgi:hypothetical protein
MFAQKFTKSIFNYQGEIAQRESLAKQGSPKHKARSFGPISARKSLSLQNLIYRYFSDSALFPIVLILMGLIIIGAGI